MTYLRGLQKVSLGTTVADLLSIPMELLDTP